MFVKFLAHDKAQRITVNIKSNKMKFKVKCKKVNFRSTR